MKNFIRSKAFKFLVVIVCALLVGTVFAVATADSVSPASTVFGTVLKPVQSLVSTVSKKIGDFGSYFASSKTLQAEVERLSQQVEQYEAQLADYNDMKHKISSYEAMLDLKQKNPDYNLVYSSVIGSDGQDAFGSLVIDKGSRDGVNVNDPVVSGNNLLGVVKKVNETYCVVETILNPDVNISAMESKTRETSYVTSTVEQAKEGRCIMAGLERTTAVSPGGIILTSGVGGVFPKGLIIGTVSQVLESDYDITCYAVITPAVDTADIEDVFIVTSFNGQGAATK